MSIKITTNQNTVTVAAADKSITIVNNNEPNRINVVQPVSNIIYVATPGPQGPAGTGGGGVVGSFVTSSWTGSNDSQFAGTSSFATTASYALNIPTIDTSSLVGTGSFNSFTSSIQTQVSNLTAATSSYILTSATSSMIVSGAFTASYYQEIDPVFVAKSASFATTGSNTFIGNQIVTGSLFTTGSNTLIGSTILTGSLSITGSTTQIGNNTLAGNTILSGSIIVSGAFGTNNPTVKIYGDTAHNGYIRFEPVFTNIDTSISASYIYVSGSTNDLYFSQNGSGYNNVTRLRWLEGNLYTGLLHGGNITAGVGGTTFNISSGSGIVVDLNASLNDDPYPTIKFVTWGNIISQSINDRTTAVQTFVGIDSNGQVIQQTAPWFNGQYNESISIGTVIHQNKSTVNASITYPNVAYGYKQRTYDFIKAFGPLKLSGYKLNTSSSLGLTVNSGTAFADGRNYQTDPNNPSYITDPGTAVSKIFRYYQSGSEFVQDTNNALGYTGIDTTRYNPDGSGSLASTSGGKYYAKRVFWYPNSATKGIVVYYGLGEYNSLDIAQRDYQQEPFVETPNTQQNAIQLATIFIRGNGSFSTPSDYRIIQSGLFRSVVGGSGGSGGGASDLSALSDVQLGTILDKQSLIYDFAASKWKNSYSLSGSLIGTASWATQALTASFLPKNTYQITASWAQSASQALTASFLPVNTYQITASWAESASNALTASYISTLYSSNFSASFGSSTTWTIDHNLNTRYVIVQTFNSNHSQILPQEITLTNANTATATFSQAESGYAVVTVGGALSYMTSPSPGGNANEVQYNNGAGGFSGDAKLIFDGTSLIVKSSDNVYDAFSTGEAAQYAYTQLPLYRRLSGNLQDELITNAIQTGDMIDATLSGTTQWDLVYLDTDSNWKPVDQTSNTQATQMLGITDGSRVFIEGYLVIGDSGFVSNVPGVAGTLAAGKPVYIRESATSAPFLSTTVPTSGIVRIVGHLIRNYALYYWLMKFRPDHTWVEV